MLKAFMTDLATNVVMFPSLLLEDLSLWGTSPFFVVLFPLEQNISASAVLTFWARY